MMCMKTDMIVRNTSRKPYFSEGRYRDYKINSLEKYLRRQWLERDQRTRWIFWDMLECIRYAAYES